MGAIERGPSRQACERAARITARKEKQRALEEIEWRIFAEDGEAHSRKEAQEEQSASPEATPVVTPTPEGAPCQKAKPASLWESAAKATLLVTPTPAGGRRQMVWL